MTTVTFNLYDTFRKKQMTGIGGVDLSAVTVKVMIVKAGYTPDQNAHDFRSDLGVNEVSGTGYTSGGHALSNPVVSMDTAGHVSLDFDDPAVWAQDAAGFSNGRRAIAYVARGGASSADELIGYSNDFGDDKGNVDELFSVTLSASGLYTGSR